MKMMQRNTILVAVMLVWVSYSLTMEKELEEKERAASAKVAALIYDKMQTGELVPEPVPGIPDWPKNDSTSGDKCRTVKALAAGPYKGKEAKIIRSLWSFQGIDILSSVEHTKYIMGAILPLITFYLKTPALHEDNYTPLYYGKINGAGRVIPETWLAHEDRINLFNFHRYELDTLHEQLFNPASNSRKLFMNKIANELDRERLYVLTHYFNARKYEILQQDPEKRCEFVAEAIEMSKRLHPIYDTPEPEDNPCPSVFLHAVLLQALKNNDVEILTNRRILYNSLAILKSDLLKNTVKKKEDEDGQTIKQKITKWLPLAEVMRSSRQIDADMYTDLLPKDLRFELIKYCTAENKNGLTRIALPFLKKQN